MLCFPIFVDLKDKEVFICGNIEHVRDKIRKLQPFHPKITVFTKNASDVILNEQVVRIERHLLKEEDLKRFPMFVIADETEEENQRIHNMCQKHHVMLNVVDHPELCDFLFPALVTHENLSIGISSGGISPTATVCIKEELDKIIPSKIDEILDKMPKIRTQIRTWNKDRKIQKNVLKKVIEQSFLKNRTLTEEELNRIKEEI